MGEELPHVVILGAGFGGLLAAKAFDGERVRVTIVDKRNHHLFQPLLYQVATAALTPTDIASPIRKVLSDQENVTVLLARATKIDVEHKRLELVDGSIDFDHLIIAAGMTNSYFGHDAWEKHATGLKSLEEALAIRDEVLLCYEKAEDPRTDDEERERLLTFVVVGGGATGVELAGALAEIARRTMTRNFRHFDPKSARVILIEGSERLLSAYPPDLSETAKIDLEELGVEVRMKARVKAIDEDGVHLEDGGHIESRTVLWAAGVKGVPIAQTLGVTLDRQGRIPVAKDLSVKDGIWAIGDIAAFLDEKGHALPGVAQVAMQQGRHAAKNILRTIHGKKTIDFRYRDLGSMATIGRSRAIAVIGRMELTGFIAWLAWLFVHLMALVGFRNRLAVLAEWMWAYVTYQRSARVILNRASPRT